MSDKLGVPHYVWGSFLGGRDPVWVWVGPCAPAWGGHGVLMAPLCPVLEPQPAESQARRMVLIKTIETRDGQVRIGGALPGGAQPCYGTDPQIVLLQQVVTESHKERAGK